MKKSIHLALVAMGLCAGFSTAAVAIESAKTESVQAPIKSETRFTAAQVEQLHTIIHNYLVSNPTVLVEASNSLRAMQEKKMNAEAMKGIAENKAMLFDDTHSPTLGSKDAPVTLVEFFDYQCGHCREMAPQIEKLAAQDKNVYIIFKELPIFGGLSANAAKVALAANMQHNKYYAFHNALLSATSQLTQDNVLAIAKKAGLNVKQLTKDMNSPVVENELRTNFQLAQSLKMIGTPTFVISNKAQTKFAYIPGATTLQVLETKIKSVQ